MSVLKISGFNKSERDCGYCKVGNSANYYFLAQSLEAEIYQKLMDLGYRRSGTVLYRSSLLETCCPPYAIRLDSTNFICSKSQKKVIKKVFNFLVPNVEERQKIRKSYPDNPTTIEELLLPIDGIEDLKIVLSPSEYTEESFELYKSYQMSIHKDKEEDVKPDGFERFLCNSPIELESVPNLITSGYGSFHQKYYYKGELIALSVLDILPESVSSVYFMYNPEYEKLSLGTFSALKEIQLTLQLQKQLPKLKYYYMGLYIHNCPKMKYKAEYHPSYLLDPSSLSWVPFIECKDKLDEAVKSNVLYTPLITNPPQPLPHPFEWCTKHPGFVNIESVDKSHLYDLKIQMPTLDERKNRVLKVFPGEFIIKYFEEDSDFINHFKEAFTALGPELAYDIVLSC